MARVRYTREQAEAEATRRAEAFMADRPDRDQYRYVSTSANYFGQRRSASKHPVVWTAVYAPIPPDDCIIDGGELLVEVDLELGTVKAGYSPV